MEEYGILRKYGYVGFGHVYHRRYKESKPEDEIDGEREEKEGRRETRPSRPIWCDVWIVEQMRYPTNRPTDRPTDQPTDRASYRGALSHLKTA